MYYLLVLRHVGYISISQARCERVLGLIGDGAIKVNVPYCLILLDDPKMSKYVSGTWHRSEIGSKSKR